MELTTATQKKARSGVLLIAFGLFVVGFLSALSAVAQPTAVTGVEGADANAVNKSLSNEASAAIDRGFKWLGELQKEDGSFSNSEFPALTALPLTAMCRSGLANTPAAKKAAHFIAGCAQDDGSIFVQPKEERKGGGLVNYNTAICMTALHETGNPDFRTIVLKARKFVASSQHLGDDVYKGGFGYDASTKRAYTDLLNTSTTLEAMRLTEAAEDFRPKGTERADVNWGEAVKFIQRVQNDPRFNDAKWVTDDEKEKGGFAYHPEQTRAGEHEGDDGTLRFRSMPGMTYAGMLSYIYADVERTDARVQAAALWVANNFDLNESSRDPEKVGTAAAKEGLFYLYNILSKGLAVYGRDTLTPNEGKPFNWRVKLLERLVAEQKIDEKTGGGYWINDSSRYWEGDKILVTAYTLIAVQNALGEVDKPTE